MAGPCVRIVALLFISGISLNCVVRVRCSGRVDEVVDDADAASDGSDNATLNVYVVPHSHMDVGWVYTVQESMHAYAANVYTTVIAELGNNPGRRFIAVEQEFFRLWWEQATEDQKNKTRTFVANGQLEFIIGGQVMHDEAVTELSAIIQQMTEGHAFIYETFGVRPRFGWHIDPFGASAATPTLFALMGFNGHLTSRIDYDKKAEMMKNKELQFMWQASPSLGSAQSMFMHVMDTYSYCNPMQHPPFSNRSGYMWNGVAKFPDPPADGIYPNMSDPVTHQNRPQYAEFLAANIKERAAWFKTPHLLWPWGCDKQFFNATDQFKNMDSLMGYLNQEREKYGIKIRYATLGEFFSALHNSGASWKSKTEGDFLPYSTARDEAWTGFYTSRIELKGLARSSQALLRAGETLFTVYTHLFNISYSVNTTTALGKLKELRWATAEVQHHDGITGTEGPKVRDMYTNHLNSGSDATLDVITGILKDLSQAKEVSGETNAIPIQQEEGGEDERPPSEPLGATNEKKQETIAVYNSLGWTVRRVVGLNVDSPNVTVINSSGDSVKSQVNPSTSQKGSYRLNFFVTLPPVGYKTFCILYSDEAPPGNATHQATRQTYIYDESIGRGWAMERNETEAVLADRSRDDVIAMENACYRVEFAGSTNVMLTITDKRTGETTPISTKFMEYDVYHDVLYGQPSNNYIFRPYGPASSINSFRVKLDVISGDTVNETSQQFYGLFDKESRYTVVTRLVGDPTGPESDPITCGHIEFDFKVGPLTLNKELAFRFSTTLNSAGNLFADVNAFQTMNRSRKQGASRAQNVFPMVSCAYIEDIKADRRVMLLSERSHGVSSPGNGDLEVMLHRRLINNEFMDHNYNLTLTEPSIATSKFWLLLGNSSSTSELRHQSWLQLENPLLVVPIGQGRLFNEVVAPKKENVSLNSAFVTDLPPNVHLLTFKTPGWIFNDSLSSNKSEAARMDCILMRLQHLYEVGEHPRWSKPVTLNLQDILSPLGTIKLAEERSLTAVWNITEMTRWKWKTEESNGLYAPPTSENLQSPDVEREPRMLFNITLNPQEIKTFFVTLQKPSA